MSFVRRAVVLTDAFVVVGTLAMCTAPAARAYGIIGRANLDGSGVNQSFITEGQISLGVVVDGTHIYWANDASTVSGPISIARANLDGTGVNLTFIPGAIAPRGVAVDGSHIYWVNQTGSIARANLDGSGANESFITFVDEPVGVAVDGTHIYWSSSFENTIARANLDGTGVNQSFITMNPQGLGSQPRGVAVDGTHVYWANSGAFVPEPGTGLLVMTGLLGLALRRRRV